MSSAETDPFATCLEVSGDGCNLLVQVVPNAGHTSFAGLYDGALRVRLAAPPIEGRANAALLVWLAKSLGLPKRAVVLISGDSARRKRLRIDCDADRVRSWLLEQLADLETDP